MKRTMLFLLLHVFVLNLSANPKGNHTVLENDSVESVYFRSNTIKLDPFKLALGGLNLSYEHFISDYKSFNIRAKYNSFGLIENFLSKSPLIAKSYYSDLLGSLKLSHWGIDTDYRFYIFHQKPCQGLYLGPYIHFDNYAASSETIMHTEIDGVETDVNLIFMPTVNLVGAGLDVGMQWLIHNRFSIDWKIFAVGGNVSMLNMHYVSDNLDAVVNPIDPSIANKPVLIPMFLSLYYFHSNDHYTQFNVLPFLHSSLSVGFTF